MRSTSIDMTIIIFEVAIAITFIASIFYFWRQSRKTKHQRNAHKIIDSLGVKYLRDVAFPDGVDGLVFIDYLLLVPNSFVVLNIQHDKGHLFGGETIDQWSQVINNKTYKFTNPLYANQNACQAVLWNLQHNIPANIASAEAQWGMHGWVVFSNSGNFPKGIPANVSMIDELKTNLASLIETKEVDGKNAISENQQKAWDALHGLSISTQTANKH